MRGPWGRYWYVRGLSWLGLLNTALQTFGVVLVRHAERPSGRLVTVGWSIDRASKYPPEGGW